MLTNLSIRLFCTFKPPQEAQKILSILNSASVPDLAKYQITEARAAKIIKWREENGKFDNCEDLLNVKGVGGRTAISKLFESITSPERERKVKRAKADTLTVPETFSEISSIKSCSSIRIGASNISWVSFGLSSEKQMISVTNLENFTFTEKKLHVGELVNKVMQLSTQIPESDCYIFENPKVATPVNPGNAEMVNINVQQSQVIAILNLILKQRNTAPFENVLFLKRHIYPRLFNLIVGSETVSTRSVVDEIMEQGTLKIDYETELKYSTAQPFEQEFLRQAMLMGLAFIKLSVFKCSRSLESLKRKN